MDYIHLKIVYTILFCVMGEVDNGSIFTITLPVRFLKHEQPLQNEYPIKKTECPHFGGHSVFMR